MNPIYEFLIGVLILVILFFLFKPQRGLVSRLMKMKKDRSRELIEDALKHLYDCEYKGVDCSLNSISGSLFISGDRSAHIISMLEAMNLISSVGNKITLTPEGRSYALMVIRVHRLLEKYLAEKTSVNETDWHIIAEEKEHKVSQEEANKLAAQLGNPLLDPHGDPIPSESGEIPTRKGLTLNNLESGTFATIIHIEDEPKEVYAQLSALKLYP